ncbi:hypothetical protein SAMN05216390_10385 [Lachnospiraceae bacterium KH1T2]|nr:hypothetical protein SAMN05216390_10385 [Lachnospiraceae bacterium KH1T2]
MRKFLLKCLAFALILGIIFVPVSVLLDPYNIFHATNISNNGVEPNKAYVKMNNVLSHPDKYDSFLFGSSRVGFFDVSKMTDGNYYDMSYSEGTPAEHLRHLKILIGRGIVPKNVTIGVDDISYFVDPAFHKEQLYRRDFPWNGTVLEKLDFYLAYFDLITLSDSIEVISKHKNTDPDYGERLLETGTENLTIPTGFNYEKTDATWSDYYTPREESFQDIKDIVDLCDEYDINLRIFTNPINGYTYQKDIANGYIVFLKKLADVTDYYNFSGFNDITLDMDNYYETSHYCPAVSDMVIDRMYNDVTDPRLLSQGFGMYVTKDNVDDLTKILYDQAVNFDLPTDTYPDTLNKVEENN